jgi:hypothetical protein
MGWVIGRAVGPTESTKPCTISLGFSDLNAVRQMTCRLIFVVLFHTIAIGHVSAIFSGRPLRIVPSFECAADRLRAAAEAALDIVLAIIAPHHDFEFPHAGFSPFEKPPASLPVRA